MDAASAAHASGVTHLGTAWLVFSQFGGSDDWRSDFPPGGCALNSSEGFPPCAYYCDEQSCDQCHPNDAGYAHLAEVVLKGIGL